jgi:hypothetical protein
MAYSTALSVGQTTQRRIERIRLGPYERTKCVRCNACCDVRCRNRKKPIDPNIRSTRALIDGRYNVRWFFDGLIYARTHVEPCWLTSQLCIPSNSAGQTCAQFNVRHLTNPLFHLNYCCFIFHCASTFCCFCCCVCFTMDIETLICGTSSAVMGQLPTAEKIGRGLIWVTIPGFNSRWAMSENPVNLRRNMVHEDDNWKHY